ncbi:MAG: DNA repair protein RecN [Candidatus Melainabacteria bacterium]|nr:DNA repair protein RecN [Candidatus Melainabacteria bacterium]
MLTQLRITNFAIIDELDIFFKNGLTVLTGETGAGKSIIADALDFLFGSRGSTDLIKTGTNKAQIEGSFLVNDNVFFESVKPWLEKNGFDACENNNISISRELSTQGSKARINGSLANVSHLLYLREFLLDIHEQSEHIGLLKIEKQLDILDNYGDKSHKKLIGEYKTSFEEYQVLKNKLNHHLEHSADIIREINSLEFEINEIKSARIKNLLEDVDLQAKREILLNKKELTENTNLIYEIINGENQNNLLALLIQIKKLISKSSEYDKSFEPYLETIENTVQEIKDLSGFVNNYREKMDGGGNALPEVEERLDILYSLKKKYGKSLTDVNQYLEKIESNLNELKDSNISYEELEKSFKEKEHKINILADKLTASRESLTKDFVNKVNEELKTLGFKEVIFVVEFVECELALIGKEQIQFLFTANPDEPPKPLLKVASGGELSRIMLAIKSIACKSIACNAPTMIFDEIDIGVSGEVASSVAKKLYTISRANQVISITHQPIIAAMADSHFVIEKFIVNNITQVSIKEITFHERKDALATLLTPDKKLKEGITEDARHFAQSLLENAKKIKEKDLVKIEQP